MEGVPLAAVAVNIVSGVAWSRRKSGSRSCCLPERPCLSQALFDLAIRKPDFVPNECGPARSACPRHDILTFPRACILPNVLSAKYKPHPASKPPPLETMCLCPEAVPHRLLLASKEIARR